MRTVATRFLLAALLTGSPWAIGLGDEPPTKDLSKYIPAQRAMREAQGKIAQGQTEAGIAILEEHASVAADYPLFKNAIRDAYATRVRELTKSNGDAKKLEHYKQRAKAWGANLNEFQVPNVDSPTIGPPVPLPPTAGLGTETPEAPIRPPIPDAPKGAALDLGIKEPVTSGGKTLAQLEAERKRASQDEHLKEPEIVLTAATDNRRVYANVAHEAFTQQRFDLAIEHYRKALGQNEPLTVDQKDECAYAMLHRVASALNERQVTKSNAGDYRQQATEARALGSKKLHNFADTILAKLPAATISEATPAPTEPIASQGRPLETTSFKIVHRGQAKLAQEVADIAEVAKRELSQRWGAPPQGEWSPKCEIVLHDDNEQYRRRSGKELDLPGHCTVEFSGERVTTRRIDLCADAPGLLDNVLPNQITQVIITEMFSEQALPRWAVVGMAALSESPDEIGKYTREVPVLLQAGKLYALGAFMDQKGFVAGDSIELFYAQSVGIVSYLVKQKDAKTFAIFMREAGRRGYDRALEITYGIKGTKDLQARWKKSIAGMKD